MKAARVGSLTGRELQWQDRVVPGIPFYYAVVDRDLFTSGSEALLYEGSVTAEAVLIPLEEWARGRKLILFIFSPVISLFLF